MYYAQLNPKQKRIIEKDVEALFTPAALLGKLTPERMKKLDVFHPMVKIGRGLMFLSETGISAVRRIGLLLAGLPAFSSCVSRNEIDNEVLKHYNNWLTRGLQPNGEEFTQAVGNALAAKVKNYEFLALIEGIDLGDLDVVDLGSVRIRRSNRALLEQVKFGGNLTLESIYDQFKDHLWIVARSRGSHAIAQKQAEEKIRLTVGILAVCGAVLYKGAIWRTCVRPLISPAEHRGAVSQLSWEVGGESPSVSRSWGDEQVLPFKSDAMDRLRRDCHLERLCSLLDQAERSELEDAIVRSIYWFADAYKDRNPTMQFVKLWSCVECFFSIEKDELTKRNAEGIAAVLTFGGYRIVELGDYASFKRRIKKMYTLRSKAVHRAKFDHVEFSDLYDFSRWVAWLILCMVGLSEKGYKTLRQIQVRTVRLDRLSTNSLPSRR